MSYSSIKFVRKFKFCVSLLVKLYPVTPIFGFWYLLYLVTNIYNYSAWL